MLILSEARTTGFLTRSTPRTRCIVGCCLCSARSVPGSSRLVAHAVNAAAVRACCSAAASSARTKEPPKPAGSTDVSAVRGTPACGPGLRSASACRHRAETCPGSGCRGLRRGCSCPQHCQERGVVHVGRKDALSAAAAVGGGVSKLRTRHLSTSADVKTRRAWMSRCPETRKPVHPRFRSQGRAGKSAALPARAKWQQC